jgi:hypothetical protein
MKNLIAALLLSVSALSAQAGALDNYNAKYVNTPAAKQAALKSLCGDTATFFQCEYTRKHGVPDGDIRHAIIAASVIAGAGAGSLLFTTPMIVGEAGPLYVTLFGHTIVPSLAATMATGAVVAGTVAAVATAPVLSLPY